MKSLKHILPITMIIAGCMAIESGKDVARTSPTVPVLTKFEPAVVVLSQGETETVEFYLLTRYDVRYEGFVKFPQADGLNLELVKYTKIEDIHRQVVRMWGQKWVKIRAAEIKISGDQLGEYVVDFGEVKTQVREKSKYDREELMLKTHPLSVSIVC